MLALEEFVKAQIKTFQKTQRPAAAKQKTPQLKRIAQAVLQATQRLGSHMASHPFHSLAVFLALVGQRVSATSTMEILEGQNGHGRQLSNVVPPPPSVNVSVGVLFTQDINSFYRCGTLAIPYQLACPVSQISMSDISSFVPQYQFPKWLSFSIITQISFQGTPLITDRFWQAVDLNVFVYSCPSSFNGNTSTCSSFSTKLGRHTFWIPDTPPYVITNNETSSTHTFTYPNGTTTANYTLTLAPGIQLLQGPRARPGASTLAPSSGTLTKYGIADGQGDANTWKTFYRNETHGAIADGHRQPSTFITTIESTGVIAWSPAPGYEGVWLLDQYVFNTLWNRKTGVTNYNMEVVTWESYTWMAAALDIDNSILGIKAPPKTFYLVQSNQVFSIQLASSALFKDPNGNEISEELVPAGNGTFPLNLIWDTASQTAEWTLNPTRDSLGAYSFAVKGCNQPSNACIEANIASQESGGTMICIPATPSCITTVPITIRYHNTNPSIAQTFPASTTIGTLTRTTVQSFDADLQDVFLSTNWSTQSTLSAQPIISTSETFLSRDPGTGVATWQLTFIAQPGTPTGIPYTVTISGNDGHGGTADQYWIVTLNPRPIQIKSGLQSTVASTSMQRPGSAIYPLPFRAPDLTDAQLPAFATQVDVQIPEALAPFVRVDLNTTALSYNVSWTGIPGHGGAHPIVFTYTDPLTGQQTSTQTFLEIANAGPYKISNPVLVTGLTGTPVSYDLATHFGHLDPDTALHFSADLPAGLDLSDRGLLTGMPQVGGSNKISLSVTDDYGRALSSVKLDLRTPYTVLTYFNFGSLHLGASQSRDLCAALVTDAGISGCGNFVITTQDFPPALGASTTGNVLSLSPTIGSGAQGNHTFTTALLDKITGTTYPALLSVAYPNQVPLSANGVSQKTVTSTDESVFTTPYMDAADPDGDSLERIITGIPTGCLSVDSEKQLSCTNVPAGNYPVVFSFSDGHGGTISATLLLQISRVTQIPWYISRAQDALPGIAGSFFLFFLPVFLKYRRDRRKTAGLDALYSKLPRVIADITKRQGAYLHHPALSHESHPLGVIPLKSTAERSQRKIPTLTAVATSGMAIPPETPTGAHSPRASSPGGLRRRVNALLGAGVGAGAGSTSTPTPPDLMAATPPTPPVAQPLSLALSNSKQASHLSVTLMDKVRALTDDSEDISEFQIDFNSYLKALDQYHEHQGPDIVRSCNLMKLTEAIAQRLDDLIDRTRPQITDKITMMVHWLKLLYVRFVFYSSGLRTSPSIKLIDKRNLLQGLTELIKAVRSRLDNPQLLALYKELEFLRALITSVPDEDRASFWKSLPFPCIRRPDRGTATLPDDALIPKAWFLQVLAIQELSQIARVDLSALTQLNTWVESANGEGITGWIPFKKHYPHLQITVGELLALRPLSHSKDRGEVNYWAADAYLSILEYWNLDSTRVQASDLEYLTTLTLAASKMFSRTFADQVPENFIKNIVLKKLQENLLNLFKKLPAEMAASLLLNLDFKQAIIQDLITKYLTEIRASLDPFYTEIRKQYKNPEKAKAIDAWLRTAPDDTPGVIKLRGDILTWRSVHSGRALPAWGTFRSLSTGTAAGAGTSADKSMKSFTDNPLRGPGVLTAMTKAMGGARAPVIPGPPIGHPVLDSSGDVARLWRGHAPKKHPQVQAPGRVRDQKDGVGAEC